MVKNRYIGIADPKAAFGALRPFRDEIIHMATRVRPQSTDYLVLQVLIGALDTVAYHFTREPDFFSVRPQISNYRPGD